MNNELAGARERAGPAARRKPAPPAAPLVRDKVRAPKIVARARSAAHFIRWPNRVPPAIIETRSATPAAHACVANAILDCGWGKAPQAIENGDGALELVHRIERIIVEPEEIGRAHV